MSGYASTGGRNVNPPWPEFVEREADLERAERAASGESRPTFLPPSALATSVAQFTEQYDQWMAKRLGKTVDELRAGRAEFKAQEAAKKAAREFEASIEIDFAETTETEIAEVDEIEPQKLREDEDEMSEATPQTGLIEATNATAIAVYSRMPDTTLAVQFLGNSIAKSGMFGCSSVEQGHVMALECLTTGVPPLTMAKRYHVINNQLSMRADFMLAEFHRRGGSSKWVERSAEVAHLKLSKPGADAQDFRLSWEDAQKEPFPYKGNEGAIIEMLAKGQKPALKAKYATPRSRMQMLAARVVSDAIRAIMPEVNEGRYTPEEFDAEDWTEAGATVQPVKVETVHPVQEATVATQAQTAATVVESVQDAEPLVSMSMALRIDDLAAYLIDRKAVKSSILDDLLARRNLTSLAELTAKDAEEIFSKLEARAETLPASDATVSEPVDSIIGEAEVLELRTLIGELNQQQPKAVEAIKAWLKERGLSKLNELHRYQYRELRAKTAVENLEAFIAASLEQVKEGINSGN